MRVLLKEPGHEDVSMTKEYLRGSVSAVQVDNNENSPLTQGSNEE